MNNKTQTVMPVERLIYAKVIQQKDYTFKVVAVDAELNLMTIEITHLRSQPKGRVINKYNLQQDSNFFETFYVKTEGSTHLLNELNEEKANKEESMFKKLRQMRND